MSLPPRSMSQPLSTLLDDIAQFLLQMVPKANTFTNAMWPDLCFHGDILLVTLGNSMADGFFRIAIGRR